MKLMSTRQIPRPVRVVAGISFPTFLLIYVLMFERSVRDLSASAANYPRVLLAVVGALAVVELVGSLLQDRDSSGSPTVSWISVWRNSAKVLVAIVLCAAWIYAVPQVGFYLASSILCIAAFLAFGVRPRVAFIVTPVFVVACYVVFSVLLQVRLPRGQFL